MSDGNVKVFVAFVADAVPYRFHSFFRSGIGLLPVRYVYMYTIHIHLLDLALFAESNTVWALSHFHINFAL